MAKDSSSWSEFHLTRSKIALNENFAVNCWLWRSQLGWNECGIQKIRRRKLTNSTTSTNDSAEQDEERIQVQTISYRIPVAVMNLNIRYHHWCHRFHSTVRKRNDAYNRICIHPKTHRPLALFVESFYEAHILLSPRNDLSSTKMTEMIIFLRVRQ